MDRLRQRLTNDFESLLNLKQFLDNLLYALEDEPGNYLDVLDYYLFNNADLQLEPLRSFSNVHKLVKQNPELSNDILFRQFVEELNQHNQSLHDFLSNNQCNSPAPKTYRQECHRLIMMQFLLTSVVISLPIINRHKTGSPRMMMKGMFGTVITWYEQALNHLPVKLHELVQSKQSKRYAVKRPA